MCDAAVWQSVPCCALLKHWPHRSRWQWQGRWSIIRRGVVLWCVRAGAAWHPARRARPPVSSVVHVGGPALLCSEPSSPCPPGHTPTPSRNQRRRQAKGPARQAVSLNRKTRRLQGSQVRLLVRWFLPSPSLPQLTAPIHLYQFLSCACLLGSSQRALISPLHLCCWSGRRRRRWPVMEPLEVAITIIFDALLLVFMLKLFFAMFQMKLVVILFYLVILLFAMAFSGRAPSSF